MNSGSSVPGAVLAALSRFTGADRLYSLDLERPLGRIADMLVVDRWWGRDALSDGFEWWVDVFSVDASLPLDDLVAQRATLWTRAADGSRIPRTGLVREAVCVGSDGGLARYRLCLVPWSWLLTQGRHSRVFQDRTVLEILAAVFAGYAPYDAWRVADEVGQFLADVRPRSYCVQYRESDFDFVSRLLAEEGLGWRIEEADDAAAGHQLVVFASSAECPQDATAELGGGVRFHRSDAAESSDAVQALGRCVGIGSGAITLVSPDYKGGVVGITTPLWQGAGTTAALEAYDPPGAYAFADHAAAARYARLMADADVARREEWIGQSTVRSFRAGRWLAVRTGAAALVGGMPDELLLVTLEQAGVNNLPDTLRDLLPRLPITLEPGSNAPSCVSWEAVWARAEAVGHGNTFTAVPRTVSWRPVLADGTGARMNPRPTAPGYQTAIVVGADGGTTGELHSDTLGRVRVRFHFQHDPGAEAASDSCWLRVSQRYAGPGVGSQFLPRTGQEVLVGFLEGDIDRPIVVGSLYNGQGDGGVPPTPGGESASAPRDDQFGLASDHRPSAQGDLAGGNAPAWHGMSGDGAGHRNRAALSGFKSREFSSTGHNRLVFDDTTGQLRLQLATTQAASQLNLGHLIHQADNFRGSFRGEGFELRTDQWGAIRGRRGLWVSAYANHPGAPAGEHVAATALLKQVTLMAQAFNDLAGTHLTVKLAAHRGAARSGQSMLSDELAPLPALQASAATTVDGSDYLQAEKEAGQRKSTAGARRVPHTGGALLGLSAPAGIGLVAGQSLHWSAGETLTVASGADSNLTVAGDLRIHAGQAIGWLAGAAVEGAPTGGHALALVSAGGELQLEAQNGLLKLQSKEQLKVVSVSAEVELAAGKAVHLATEGGASITIEGGNISVACPGAIKVHAGKKSFVGAAQLSREMNSWPGARFSRAYAITYDDGTPAANVAYRLLRQDGAVVGGVTDSRGRIPTQHGLSFEEVTVEILDGEGDRGHD
ncbi:type VI secretion system Vgr family protein [Novilysobacter luteus]|uniref:Type VI secretion system tip protein VgrG n=1 Tax=Novilysobacter luteus TaxID=2822368 RepID=A0ABN7R0E2_9GAMM|nr:type VI secretion system Vgr family protein [Lysobacter luteus]CAG4976561.1 hypothetical protein LYB30171_02216 [Lysobacter luteus]